MAFFVKIACPFLDVEYENEYKSHPVCDLYSVLLDVHEKFKKEGCTGCWILDLTPTQRFKKYKKLYGGKNDKRNVDFKAFEEAQEDYTIGSIERVR